MKLKDFQKLPYIRKESLIKCGELYYPGVVLWELLKLCRRMKKIEIKQVDSKLIIEYSSFNCRGKFTINSVGLKNANAMILELEL